MTSSTVRKTGLFAGIAAASALVVIGVPLALAAPTAAPPSDAQGYVDSTARCTKPDTAVVFGTTGTSRVAICQTAAGGYEYRGVRVRDGAKLIAPATQTSDQTFVAKSDGVSYTVTPTALSVTAGGNTFRTESWTDYHGPAAPATSGTSTGTAATTSKSGTSSASTSASTSSASTSASSTATSGSPTATPGLATSAAPKTSAAPATSAPPLPPPLPAEVGGGSTGTR